jgi:hypothetical protein
LATFLLSAACDTLFQPGEFHCVQENWREMETFDVVYFEISFLPVVREIW